MDVLLDLFSGFIMTLTFSENSLILLNNMLSRNTLAVGGSFPRDSKTNSSSFKWIRPNWGCQPSGPASEGQMTHSQALSPGPMSG